MALINLTEIKGLVNDVKKSLYLDETAIIKFIAVNKVILQLEDGWYLDKNPVAEFSDIEYHVLSIATTINLDEIIPMTTSIKIGSTEYFVQNYMRNKKDDDFDATILWEIKVQTEQMRRDL